MTDDCGDSRKQKRDLDTINSPSKVRVFETTTGAAAVKGKASPTQFSGQTFVIRNGNMLPWVSKSGRRGLQKNDSDSGVSEDSFCIVSSGDSSPALAGLATSPGLSSGMQMISFGNVPTFPALAETGSVTPEQQGDDSGTSSDSTRVIPTQHGPFLDDVETPKSEDAVHEDVLTLPKNDPPLLFERADIKRQKIYHNDDSNDGILSFDSSIDGHSLFKDTTRACIGLKGDSNESSVDTTASSSQR